VVVGEGAHGERGAGRDGGERLYDVVIVGS